VERAKAQGALVSTNPGVRQLSARAAPFQESLRSIDILTLNRAEADLLVPTLVAKAGEGGPALPLGPGEEPPRLAIRGLTGGGFELSLVSFFRALNESGPRYVVLTDGRAGAFVGSRERIWFCPALEARVAGTAGAGDAFAATFSCYVALGRPPEQALRAATVNAASVVGYVDTQSGLLDLEGVESRLNELSAALIVRGWLA